MYACAGEEVLSFFVLVINAYVAEPAFAKIPGAQRCLLTVSSLCGARECGRTAACRGRWS